MAPTAYPAAIGLFMAMVVSIEAQCPALCTCSTNQVSCTGANFTAIPRPIPHSTNTLDLSDNLIHHVTYISMTSLRSMVELSLKQNVITTVDEGAFQAMESLQVLDLSHNRLSSVTEQTFIGVDTLMQLDLGHNNLQHIDGALAGLGELSRLDLRNNQIHRITQFTFRDLENLQYLFLADNNISHIDRRAFRNMEKLMYLVLKGNPVHRVPKFEFHSQFLTYIDLSECGLADVPRGLPNTIRYLQLRRNNFTELTTRSFRNYPYVSILVLDENEISYMEPDVFDSLTYLQQLWLNGNQITSLPARLPATVQRLLMDQNHVTSVGQSFPRNSQLHTLSLMGNDITHVKHNAFGRLRRLVSLDMSNNKIKQIYGNMFQNNTELKSLLLSKNPLEYIHSHGLWGLKRLRTLSLAYIENHVNIHHDAFNDVKHLQALHLDSSPPLVKLILTSPHFTQRLKSIQELSLKGSELSTLDSNFPLLFPNLTTLALSSSLWHCDRALLWLRDWVETSVVAIDTVDGEMTCYSPQSLHGRPLASLSDHEFVDVTTTKAVPASTRAVIFTTFPTTVTMLPTTTTIPATKKPGKSEQVDGDTDEDNADTDYEGSSDPVIDYHGYDYSREDERESEIDTDTSLGFEDPFSDYHSFNDPTERRHISWEEYLSRSPIQPHITTIPNPWYNHEGNSHPDSTLDPLDSSLQYGDPGGGLFGNPNHMIIIIVIVAIATVIIAIIIIALIIYFIRKQRTVKEKPPAAYQNGIPLKHKNDVLYFMPNGTKSQTSGDITENKSMTESTKSISSGRSKTKEHVTLLSSRDITLVPGRDINHEGPMRVYKWEDF